MKQIGFQDLDELVLTCRNLESRSYIAEAVECYRAGAYRSAIITSWIAVVFDFVHKLRELEMTGDKNAKKKLEQFDSARKAHDTAKSLLFERSVVESMSEEFELISPIEAVDFQRLFEDRNRCAHPSMISSDDAFQPTPELARMHIVVPITSLLQKPPVQGKAALDRILADIDSEYFPSNPEKAAEFLKNGTLQRARPSLIRSVVICLLKDIFQESRSNAQRMRQYAALLATLKLHHEPATGAIKEKLATLAVGVDDKGFNKVVRFLGTVPGAWDWVGDTTRIRAKAYVIDGPADKLPRYIPYALQLPDLYEITINRLEALDDENMLQKLIRVKPDIAYANYAIKFLEKSNAFRTAEDRLSRLILPLAPVLLAEHLQRICNSFEANDQIAWASGAADQLLELFRKTSHLGEGAKPGWKKVFDVLSTHEYYKGTRGEELRTALKTTFGFTDEVSPEIGSEASS